MKIIKTIFYLVALFYFFNAIQNVLKVYVFQTAQWWEIPGALNNLMLLCLIALVFIVKTIYKIIKSKK